VNHVRKHSLWCDRWVRPTGSSRILGYGRETELPVHPAQRKFTNRQSNQR
jgi:hypothetical protein